ncbi:SH3 domain-containing protein [Peribacillus kribbensis]|uniref:SH3 domain-containing protein n=1 Tax=Peribacillus kribbensis TaxID=356658 RepID=UPI000408A22F|nr:SH3 domain-containing protein [Peribacillus kribbensis]
MKNIAKLTVSLSLLSSFAFYNIGSASAATQMKVNASSLNIRQNPGSNYKVVGSLKNNQIVTILGQQGTWTKVPNGKSTGWVSSQYLKAYTAPAANATGTTYYVTATSLNVHSSGTSKASVVTTVKKDEAVTVTEKKGTWAKIKTASGKTGWVSLSYLTTKAPAKPAAAFKPATAAAASGTKYYVTATSLSVRSSGTTKASVVTTIKKNEAVTVYEKKGTWARLKTASGKTGWASLSYLTTKAPAKPEAVSKPAPAGTKYYVKASALNVRTSASLTASVTTTVKHNEAVMVYEKKGTWARIQTFAGKTGWVSLSYLTTAAPSAASNPAAASSAAKKALSGRVFVVDPGHGGVDVGAVGKNSYEKTINLKTANELKALLTAAGAKVIMTRTTDTQRKPELSERTAISNKYKPDAFISIHTNSGSSAASGVETYYHTGYVNESELARDIQSELVKATGMKDRKAQTENFYVVKYNHMAAVLVEVGFISNPSEEKLLNTTAYQKKAAQGIFNGLVKFYQ